MHRIANVLDKLLNGAALLPLGRAGVLFNDGVQVERDDQEVKQVADDAA